MVRLIVRVIGTDVQSKQEIPMAELESDHYDPDHLESQILQALDLAVSAAGESSLHRLRHLAPEVSAVLTADDEAIRPSLHLTSQTVSKLAEAGASVDFDPYL